VYNEDGDIMDDKIKLVKKYFKGTDLLFEIEMINYESHNLYMRLDYFKRLKVYRVSWIDLDQLEDRHVDKYLGTQYIQSNIIDLIKRDLDGKLTDSIDLLDKDIKDGLVIVNIYLNNQEYSYKFNRYIPKSLPFLGAVFANMFDNLPRKVEPFLFELTSVLLDNNKKYDYKKPIKFNLFKSNLEDIFDKDTITKGKDYLSKVIYLEKYDKDRYFAVVQGTEKYLIVIKYDEDSEMLQLYCSCPYEAYCKHLYAVIKNIRDNKFKKFYKVYIDDGNTNLLERLTNFNFNLCLGVVDNNLEIVNNNGGIELVPILNQNGTTNWRILEDDKKETLKKEIEKVIKG